jgi:hypothetical protein
LEKAYFLKSLQFLKEKRINVVEVITDAHTKIAYLICTIIPLTCPPIVPLYDDSFNLSPDCSLVRLFL